MAISSPMSSGSMLYTGKTVGELAFTN